MGEGPQLAGMVRVLVGQENLRHLFGPITQGGKGLHIAADIPAGEDGAGLIRRFLRRPGGDAGVHQDDLAAGVDQIVLQAAAIANSGVEFPGPLLSAEGKGLGIKPVPAEFHCFDFHLVLLLISTLYS